MTAAGIGGGKHDEAVPSGRWVHAWVRLQLLKEAAQEGADLAEQRVGEKLSELERARDARLGR